jgi:TM2 domain-containing membrane protein YozV
MQDRVYEIRDPGEKRTRVKQTKKVHPAKRTDQKNPAVALSLSLLFWGGGQFYNDQVGRGVLFFLLMSIYSAVVLVLIFGQETVAGYLSYEKISMDFVFIALGLFYALGVLLWAFNADQAYHRAAKSRREAFTGVSSKVTPVLCSLLIPGWGQFLNGQDKKGGVFLGLACVSLLSVATILGIILLWPSFEVDRYRIFFEMMLVIALIYTPLIPIVWLISAFDALKVSIDEVKKESFLKRMKYVNYRRKMHGLRGIIPHYRLTMALGVLLVTILSVGFFMSPQKYYMPRLKNLHGSLVDKKMVIIPYVLEKIIRDTDSDQRSEP